MLAWQVPSTPPHAVLVATQLEPLQQLPAVMQPLLAQQAAPSLPQAAALPFAHTMPLVPGMFWPDATQPPATQQPPPEQVLPGQQRDRARRSWCTCRPSRCRRLLVHAPVSATHWSLPGLQQPLAQLAPAQQG